VLTVDIDVGGTLTDGIFSDGDKLICCKVDTTTHDLTVCLFDCLTQGAAGLGYSGLDSLLENVGLIRWSTTITSNVLAERRGPRVGLLITRGHEQDLYGPASPSPVLDRLVLARDVVGLGAAAGREQITHAARSLLESGVRRICISLQAAHLDPQPEIRIKEIIDQQYPDHFLGSVPVLAGSDISKSADDMTRTYCAILNAYTHSALAAALFKAEDELREDHRYSGTFLVSHINGGVSGIAKARAIDTIESGPVLGIAGSAFFAQAYRRSHVVALDVGGTTAKVSVLNDSAPIHVKPSDFFGIPVQMSLPYLRSIGLGGGSVVKLALSQKHGLTLGPESLGSLPGPACYSLGGDQPTLTDAFVAAGLINPDYFLGGTRQLDAGASRDAIQKVIAAPLNISVEKAAGITIDTAFGCVADLIAAARSELGQGFSQHALFAYGGNGGLFACGVADKADLDEVYLFSLGAVFSAFGSSVSDISHVYERSLNGLVSTIDIDRLNYAVDQMKAEARKDMLGEGFEPDAVDCSLELEISSPCRTIPAVPCPEPPRLTSDQLRALLETRVGSTDDSLCLDLARLRANKRMPKPKLSETPLQGADSSHAQKGLRKVAWGSRKGEARIYCWEQLQPGNLVEGCAVIEGVNTTYFVPEGWTMTVDQYGNAIVSRR
jgi:N-methylhydantoinase A/oxoprolinase/acetone carboxylase beta subunit